MESDGVWRTISGRKVFIEKGQSLKEAMKNSGKFKSEKPKGDSIKNEKPKGDVKKLAQTYYFNTNGKKIRDSIKQFDDDSIPNGTYDLVNKKAVIFNDGYQATFQTTSDNYSNAEYGKLVDKYKKLGDNKVYAGKYGKPEVSFHFKNEKDAMEICKKYNQVSYWNWETMSEVPNPYYKKGRGNDYE